VWFGWTIGDEVRKRSAKLQVLITNAKETLRAMDVPVLACTEARSCCLPWPVVRSTACRDEADSSALFSA